jgi:hypothetical protein
MMFQIHAPQKVGNETNPSAYVFFFRTKSRFIEIFVPWVLISFLTLQDPRTYVS